MKKYILVFIFIMAVIVSGGCVTRADDAGLGYQRIKITSPSNGAVITGSSVILTIQVAAEGDITSTKFDIRNYSTTIISYEDTSHPFSYTWDTTPYAAGQYRIMVTGLRANCIFCMGDDPETEITITLNK